MYENIKSQYFMKLLFDYLEEKIKLKLIKYNKSLQNFFGKNLIKYKIFSGKYIIYETNNKGKEYDSYNDKLIFEGEYLNGERNGKGKEYNEDEKLIFEGEYLNGKRNGKGKKYNNDGKLIFEGEYMKGKIWNGNGYDGKKNCIFELKNGNGIVKSKYIYSDEIKYEIDYSNGLLNGKGKEYYYNGKLEFEGEYLNGKRNGKGKEYHLGIIRFEGIFKWKKKWKRKRIL